MRKTLTAILAAGALLVGGACTTSEEVRYVDRPAATGVGLDTTARNGWDPQLIAESYPYFADGFGDDNNFSRCAFNHLVDNHTPEDFLAADVDIRSAIDNCQGWS